MKRGNEQAQCEVNGQVEEKVAEQNAKLHGMRAFGNRHGRRFWRAAVRGAFAMLLVAALVVSDALPVGPPVGLPDAVEAAGPSKGTLTFYKWKRITTWEQLNGSYIMLLNNIDGRYYMAQSLKDINNSLSNWYLKSIDMDPNINPGADEFYTKTCWSNIYTCLKTFNGKYGSFDGYYMREYYDNAWHWVSHTTEYLKSMTDGATLWIPYDRTMGESGKGFEMRWGTINNNTVWLRPKAADANWPVRLDWDGWTGNTGCWEVFGRSTKTFTCINAHYTLGNDQVYVADSDLFLKEGVKLTIPEGAVLCVKNGPFYVNGEIECSGTILVEDGGIIMPMQSSSGGSRIVMKEGGAMIIRSGGRVYAGCPKDSLGTEGNSGWLDMYAGSSIINFGLFIAGKCCFKYGQATLENHNGGKMFIGYYVRNDYQEYFVNSSRNDDVLKKAIKGDGFHYAAYYGASKSGGGATVAYGKGNNQTVLKTWEGALTCLANKSSDGGETIKKYYYDKDGNCTVDSNYKPY